MLLTNNHLLFVVDYPFHHILRLHLSVRLSVRNGRSPEVGLTPKLGSLYPRMEKRRHHGNSVIESAWTTTAHSHVINIREHARHV